MDIVFLGVFYPDVGDIYCLSTSLMHCLDGNVILKRVYAPSIINT